MDLHQNIDTYLLQLRTKRFGFRGHLIGSKVKITQQQSLGYHSLHLWSTFVCLLVCYLPHVNPLIKSSWTLLNKEELSKFWKSFASGSGFRIFKRNSSKMQDTTFFHNLSHITGKTARDSRKILSYMYISTRKYLWNFESHGHGYGRIRVGTWDITVSVRLLSLTSMLQVMGHCSVLPPCLRSFCCWRCRTCRLSEEGQIFLSPQSFLVVPIMLGLWGQ